MIKGDERDMAAEDMNKFELEADMTLETQIIKMLRERGYSLSTAESCSGGLLSARFVNIAGISDVFKAGVITYSNEAKVKQLKVKPDTLANFGAVSVQTAKEMALGVVKLAETEVSLSITGIAGPDGGTENKPVGLVYIGCCIGEKVTVKEYHFQGDRLKVREEAVISALRLLQECLLCPKEI
jgi:competence/damage-inducible protein CinA C-terminal domain